MTALPINDIVVKVTNRIYENDPILLDTYGEKGKIKCQEDNHHHLKHLQTAFELQNVQFFTDYTLWLCGILEKHGMSARHLIDNFLILDEVLKEYSHTNEASVYCTYLEEAVRALQLRV